MQMTFTGLIQQTQASTENVKEEFEDKVGRVAAKLRREKGDVVMLLCSVVSADAGH